MYQGITPTPDPGFMRKLKAFDPKLDCEFNREIERFIITQPSRLGSGKLVAAVIANPEDDHWRQPDNRDLANLAKGDFERKSHKRRIQEGEEAARERRIKDEKRAEETFYEATKDDREWLRHRMQVISGQKGDNVNAAFRRVTPKSKGFKVVDNRLVKA